MDATLTRTLFAGFFGLVMAILALRTQGQPYRRASLGLSAVGLMLLASYSAVPSFAAAPYLALVMLVFAMVAYIMSWVKGEVLKRHQELRAKMEEQLKRRREQAEKRS
ncbi:MAG: hypothetical protein H7Z42_03170 [Roseiflexaceae bacterium]|nr:hypothetical protein [Roseiflexaceae bacterium]